MSQNPFNGNHLGINHDTIVNKIKPILESQLTPELNDNFEPTHDIFSKWFNSLAFRDVNIVYIIREELSPRQMYIDKLSKFLTGSRGLTEANLIEKGILIVPFSIIRAKQTCSNQFVVDTLQAISISFLVRLLGLIKEANPRDTLPLIIVEDSFHPYLNIENLLSNLPYSNLDFGKYVDYEDIPSNEIPIKLDTTYYLDSSFKRDYKRVNQFITFIRKKL